MMEACSLSVRGPTTIEMNKEKTYETAMTQPMYIAPKDKRRFAVAMVQST